MTDSRLRELERRFRATGSVEDEAPWLRARVQAGELAESRLELAASLGHRGAGLAQGPSKQIESLRAVPVVYGPESEATRRALLACGWVAWDEWRSQRPAGFDPGGNPLPLDALVAEEAFLLCPCEKHRQQLIPGVSSLPSWVRCYLTPSERIESLLLPNDPLDREEEAQRDSVYVRAVQLELAPWLLGYSDPVKERVEARQRAAPGE